MKRFSNVLTVLFIVTAALSSTAHATFSASDASGTITKIMRELQEK